jgi:hypothetical protein
MTESDNIPFEETSAQDDRAGKERIWTEEMKVAGSELLETFKRLAREVGVRRLTIRDREKKVLLEVPLAMGLAGIAVLPMYAAVALIAALVTECTITVERASHGQA